MYAPFLRSCFVVALVEPRAQAFGCGSNDCVQKGMHVLLTFALPLHRL